jgi:hypothetical protein
MIRKEGIKISSAATESGSDMFSVPAEILTNDYLGSEVETICTFEKYPMSRIVIRSSSSSDESLPARGEKVYLQWKHEDLYLIGKPTNG